MHKYAFFQNVECEYFPCHITPNPDDFNCLFCFCPLYHLDDCGGTFKHNENGIKLCGNCLFPHRCENYNDIIKKLNKTTGK